MEKTEAGFKGLYIREVLHRVYELSLLSVVICVVFSAFLYIGVILAHFHIFGIWLLSKDQLNIIVNGCAILCLIS